MGKASRWEAAGIAEQGARHIADGTPCQDAVRVYQDPDMVIVAVADGHGDPRHARSDEGAEFAVEVAAHLLRELGQTLLEDEVLPQPLALENRLQQHLPARICWEWNRRVRTVLGHLEDSGAWHSDVQEFGTTILGALFTETLMVCVQLGDGDILVVDGQGDAANVFPPHSEIYGGITHSLCQPGAAAWARVCCRHWHPSTRLAMLSSDGVRDSLGDDEAAFLSVGDWLLRRITEQGWEAALDGLGPWLQELSRLGNGDDVTIGVVHWRSVPS